jgi:hypothetical protein
MPLDAPFIFLKRSCGHTVRAKSVVNCLSQDRSHSSDPSCDGRVRRLPTFCHACVPSYYIFVPSVVGCSFPQQIGCEVFSISRRNRHELISAGHKSIKRRGFAWLRLRQDRPVDQRGPAAGTRPIWASDCSSVSPRLTATASMRSMRRRCAWRP